MDLDRLYTLTRSLASLRSRRRLLGALAVLPVAAGLLDVLQMEDTVAKDRRRRRKGRHKRRKNPGSLKGKAKKRCKAESVALTCAGTCGNVANNCNKTVDCGPCTCIPLTECPADKTCGTIPDGCGGEVICPGSCANPTPACIGNFCLACTSSEQCASGTICDAGSCEACDVCASGCDFTSVGAAVSATTPQLTTIRVCPGTYVENADTYGAVLIDRALTLIGAGDGDDPATSTILQPAQADKRVVRIDEAGVVRLEGLRVTGGTGSNGSGFLIFKSTVTLASCTVTGNHPTDLGGGMTVIGGADVSLVDTLITLNSSMAQGGGIEAQTSNVTLDTLSRVTGNTGAFVGGIRAGGGTITLPSVDNVTNNTPNDCTGSGFTGPGAVCTTT